MKQDRNGGTNMYITITTSKPTPEQLPEVEAFLHQFLPRVQQQSGVVAVYHYVRPPFRPTEEALWSKKPSPLSKRTTFRLAEKAIPLAILVFCDKIEEVGAAQGYFV